MSRPGKSTETESRLVVARGWEAGRGRNGEWLLNGYEGSFLSDENVLEIEGRDGCITS